MASKCPIEELLGTKLRALYQRKKGRDLFDLWHASTVLNVNPERVVACFMKYLAHERLSVSRAEFEMNLFEKLNDQRFLGDIRPLLTQESVWNHRAAARYILQDLAPLIPGNMWLKTDAEMAVFLS